MKFEDHFSSQSGQYAQFRPTYPDELYAYLVSITPSNQLAWDCGTGNGQAAVGLASHFERVFATDASANQIANAYSHAKVEYHVADAERVALESESADLVTVALAVHWFDFDNFYAEVRRVLKPNGVLAVWAYHLPSISPETDKILLRYYSDILAGFWPERIGYVEERYGTLPFPFEEIQTPSIAMESRWDLSQFTGFLDSWSGTQRYIKQNGDHPIKKIWDELSGDWEDEKEKRLVHWPLYLRIGRKT